MNQREVKDTKIRDGREVSPIAFNAFLRALLIILFIWNLKKRNRYQCYYCNIFIFYYIILNLYYYTAFQRRRHRAIDQFSLGGAYT